MTEQVIFSQPVKSPKTRNTINGLEPSGSSPFYYTIRYLIVIFSTVHVEQSPLISTLSDTACIS
jgi:hypothetical protein